MENFISSNSFQWRRPLYFNLPALLQLGIRFDLFRMQCQVILPAADDDLLSNLSIDLGAAKITWKDKEGQGEERGVSNLI